VTIQSDPFLHFQHLINYSIICVVIVFILVELNEHVWFWLLYKVMVLLCNSQSQCINGVSYTLLLLLNMPYSGNITVISLNNTVQ